MDIVDIPQDSELAETKYPNEIFFRGHASKELTLTLFDLQFCELASVENSAMQTSMLCWRAGFKMIGVHTPLNMTLVVNIMTRRDGADVAYVAESVSLECPVVRIP